MPPAPYTAYKNIQRLPPAHSVIIRHDLAIHPRSYWQPQPGSLLTDPRDCITAIRETLGNVTRRMLIGDVRVAATLSGGIDSSAVAAMASQHQAGLRSFCVSHRSGNNAGEFAAARKVADHIRSDHTELQIEPVDLMRLPQVVRAFCEPVFSSVPLHAYNLAQSISQHARVALTGNGADELFGGYADHRLWLAKDRRRLQWQALEKRGLAHWIGRLPLPFVRQSYQSCCLAPEQRMSQARLHPISEFAALIYSGPMQRSLPPDIQFEIYESASRQWPAESYSSRLITQLLLQGSQYAMVQIPDITGMAHALEYRSPFLDRDMIELALRIPASLKIDDRKGDAGGKQILRQSMQGILPDSILQMNKLGFGATIPYQKWARGAAGSYMRERLDHPALHDCGLFQVDTILKMFDGFVQGQWAHFEMLFGLVALSIWLEECL
ncbi:MAG: asparagine synthase C-terminal domain-containing protein, partial [Leptospiraceae bacterium]|nr:asparagine synthase C-terminal domain-containing protein [Leptospiraceae bacterium]